MQNHIEKGVGFFQPKARLVSILGDQLIRDATVGLLELVKNGYDADASKVEVKLLNLAIDSSSDNLEDELKKVKIIVKDDGYGMDLEAINEK